MLFIEGRMPRGVFVLCSGRVKPSTTLREGKTIITKISDAGNRLGLNAVISNRPYEMTAEMMEPGQAFIPRDSLPLMIKDFPEAAMRIAQRLSRNYFTAYEETRTLGLAASPSEKFAKLLLSLSTRPTNRDDGSSQVKLTLTHEEIAEIIATTRETVSRLFSEFKRKQLMQLKGATLVILSHVALERVVQS